MKKILFFLLISNLLWSQWSISNAERAALIALNQSTNGENWNRTWNIDEDPRTWFGIKIKNGNVVEINLSGNSLIGNFPSNIASFSHLQRLDLSSNRISGEVSPSISSLSSLLFLDISHNQLNGDPTSLLSGLSQLVELRIGDNNFEITNIANLLQNYTRLKDLDLSNLNLTVVPSKIASLNTLEYLNFDQNAINNGFEHLTSLQNLKTLNLSNNQLTKIPTELSQLNKLTSLNLSGNAITVFTGLEKLTNLEWLSLENAQLTQVPIEIKQLKQLLHINLGRNKITSGFNNLLNTTALQQIFINNNELETNFPSELLGLPQLMMLSVANNNLEGALPNKLPPICDISNNRYNKDQIYNYLLASNNSNILSYSPQRYDQATEVKAVLGESATLQQSLPSSDYIFSWFKNFDENLSTHTQSLFIDEVKDTDFTYYTAEAYYLKNYPNFLLELSLFREPIKLTAELSTDDNLLKFLNIYPNPTSDVLNIVSTKTKVENVSIFDLSGKQVLSSKRSIINVSNLPSGVYMLNIKTDKGFRNFKFIKK